MVQDQDGRWTEPNVYDIDDSELTENEIAGNWICMGIALGVAIVCYPFVALFNARD